MIFELVFSLACFWIATALALKFWGGQEKEGESSLPPRCPICWSVTLTWLVTGVIFHKISWPVTLFLFGASVWDWSKRLQKLFARRDLDAVKGQNGSRLPDRFIYYRLIPLLAVMFIGAIILLLTGDF